MRSPLVALCLWASLGGCVPKPVPPAPQVVVLPSVPPADGPSVLSGVLSSVGYVVVLPVDQQQQELAKAVAAFEQDRLPSDRLRLAMLLTLGDPTLRDPARAESLLQDAPFSADQGAYETLARLVLELVHQEEGRATDATDAAEQLAAERARRKEAEDKVAGLAELERRMEALKALETSGGQ